ncbi:MAG: cyclic nucleotide-binding domain-containing protein [Nitrospinae bacterium]|nr:cyclic nucleotide-binding domain-containing protein [Nitrospinota bacterium]
MLDKDQFLELIKDVSFFKEFSVQEREYLAGANFKAIRYHGGESIIREGDVDSSLYLLLRGTVGIYKNSGPAQPGADSSGKAFIATLKAGSVFGEISLISKKPRTTNVVADEGEAIVLKIEGDFLYSLSPVFVTKFQQRLIEILVKRLDDMNNQLVEMARANRQRER